MNIDVTKMERKEPIGAEQDDDTNSVLSLEQILQSPNKSFSTKEKIKICFKGSVSSSGCMSHPPTFFVPTQPTHNFYFIKSETPSANNSELVQKVQILEKKIEHQSSILRESEATNARLRFDLISDWLIQILFLIG